MKRVRIAFAALIGLAGAALAVTCSPPYLHREFDRVNHDIERALAPVATVPVRALREDRDYIIAFVVPDDEQWHRIRGHLGSPRFLVVVGTSPKSHLPRAYSVTIAGLQVTGASNGRPLPLTLKSDVAWGYSLLNDEKAYVFDVDPGDAVTLRARMPAGTLPDDALLMVFPRWVGLEVWDWTDSQAIGQGIVERVAPFGVAFGVFLILIGIAVGLPVRIPRRWTRWLT